MKRSATTRKAIGRAANVTGGNYDHTEMANAKMFGEASAGAYD